MNEAEKREYYSKSIGTFFEERLCDTWMLRSYKITELNFCQRFSYLNDYDYIFLTIFWYLWRGHPKNKAIDPEILKIELIRWLGKEKVDEAIQSSPEEYEEFLLQVQDLFDVLTKKYYSGFLGKILAK